MHTVTVKFTLLDDLCEVEGITTAQEAKSYVRDVLEDAECDDLIITIS